MEKFSQFAIDVFEQRLLRYYYKDEPVYDNLLDTDTTPDIFKTEKQLIMKEYGKRYSAVAKKIYALAKSNPINKYVKSEGDRVRYVRFNLSEYCKDNQFNFPCYTAKLETEINVTIIKKPCRTVRQETETKHLEVALSEELVGLKDALSKPWKCLNDAGVIKNYLMYTGGENLALGDGSSIDNICGVIQMRPNMEPFKYEVKTNYFGDLEAKRFYGTKIVETANGNCALMNGSKKSDMYLSTCFVDGYDLSEEQLIEILKKYCNLNVITLEEIEATLDSHPTKAEFNEWLEEKLKTVVIPGERLIEKQS